jgi:phosphoribosylaminoimidazole-succinocarboxamide synthase
VTTTSELIETLSNVQIRELKTQDYLPIITEAASNTFNESNLNIKPKNGASIQKYTGKVRDRYNDGANVILVTTDRLTAFDRKVTNIPFKGAVLNLVSKYWFEKTQHIMPNHFISAPHPNATIGKAVTPIPIEFVVREYLTGTTDTSILTHYQNGVRDYCGNKLPDGLRKHEKLAMPIVTPTTKSEAHDQLISPMEIIEQGIMTQQEWDYCSSKAIELFNFASQEAAKRGLILVDTKMEMGRTTDGKIILIDELFTPDSSRYWLADGYAEAFAKGDAPKNIDKEYVRKWINANCDPYKVAELPTVPAEVIAELSRRYILLYELITGLDFPFNDVLAAQDLNQAVQAALDKLRPKVGIIMGSDSDLPTMKDAAVVLEELGVEYELTLVSAHRTPQRLEEYARSARDRGLQVIIAGAGGAAHLPGMVASMTTLPVIGVPVVPPTAAYLNGVDALYSILQMPAGIPVATVAIGNATNGGLLAARILAATDAALTNKLLARQEAMCDKVLEKAAALEQKGWKETLQPPAKKAPEMLSQYSSTTAALISTPPVPTTPEPSVANIVAIFKP